jgi:hypothetical protein
MRPRLAALVLIASAACMPAPGTSNTPQSGSPMPTAILEPYLSIQSALANDSIDGVQMNAGNLTTAATSLGSPAVKIDTAAAQLTSANELPDARQKFGNLTQAVLNYMDGLHLTLPSDVHLAVCDADQRRWLQRGDAIANPYSGTAAGACGALR